MDPIGIAWRKGEAALVAGDLEAGLDAADFTSIRDQARRQAHGCYRLPDQVLLEIPGPDWNHGDVLVYVPEPGWLVRRNYGDYWYVDIGVVRPVADDLYCWTDLWLDVIANEGCTRYEVVDADELAQAVREKAVHTDLLVRALNSFHQLMALLRDNAFPTPQVAAAVATAYDLRERS